MYCSISLADDALTAKVFNNATVSVLFLLVDVCLTDIVVAMLLMKIIYIFFFHHPAREPQTHSVHKILNCK